MVSNPTAAAVSASISTPVRATVSAVTSISTAGGVSTMRNTTATRVSGSGWHNGIKSAVRFEAWMAAMRATASTSPLRASPARTRSSVSDEHRDAAAGARETFGYILGGDIHHVRLTRRVEVRKMPFGGSGRALRAPARTATVRRCKRADLRC